MEKKLSFGLDSFKVKSFRFDSTEKTIRKDRINFDIQLNIKSKKGERKCTVFFRIEAKHGKQQPISLGVIETETIYNLIGEIPYNEETDSIQLPNDLIVTFVSIGYSTTRGALLVKAQSTILADAPLPIIDPVKLWEHFKNQKSEKKSG
ncbi:hypothetical protein A8B79_01405 [Balneola sp. EhC07]|jgi:hypothetical protein|uniref:hypothetical protein n=1 Tax=Balneola sp. EhC07 TaxID=1849360 RepID=UPI0007F3D7A8|nr:hypothetical protein [Balneola sp. EhC07]OAN62911.1 hypothetical protein A8B79_01405 [Balneola sp. EhC07]